MMLVLSAVFGIFPLLGVVWIALHGGVTTVDGLFMSLILLSLSGILFLNAFLDLRARKQPKTASERSGPGRSPSAAIASRKVQNLQQLPNHKVKMKKAGQRACNEKNEKGKFCGGHLKRWFYTADVIEKDCGDVEKAWGPDTEVYRCEHCQTLYLPNPEDEEVNVAGPGQLSVFGLTVPAKE